MQTCLVAMQNLISQRKTVCNWPCSSHGLCGVPQVKAWPLRGARAERITLTALGCFPDGSRLPVRWGERLSTWRGEGEAVGRKAVHLARGERRWGERLSTDAAEPTADRGLLTLAHGSNAKSLIR